MTPLNWFSVVGSSALFLLCLVRSPKWWNGEVALDPDHPPDTWLYGVASWRFVMRMQAFGFAVLGLVPIALLTQDADGGIERGLRSVVSFSRGLRRLRRLGGCDPASAKLDTAVPSARRVAGRSLAHDPEPKPGRAGSPVGLESLEADVRAARMIEQANAVAEEDGRDEERGVGVRGPIRVVGQDDRLPLPLASERALFVGARVRVVATVGPVPDQ